MTTSSGPRCGLARVDLLAATLVLLIVAGLSAPAVVRARILSDRQRSRSHLQQIGEGLQKYHAAFGFFPSNGGPPPETVTATDYRTGFPAGDTFRWGFGDPRRAGRLQTGSYTYAILPFVGEEEVFRKQIYSAAVKIYYLPARRPAVAMPVPMKDPLHKGRFVINPNNLNPWGRTDYAANDQIVRPGMGHVMRKNEIIDGLAETVLVGEKAMDTRDVRNGSEFWDSGILLGGSGGSGRKGYRLLQDSSKVFEDVADNWGSPDAAGVQFLFADNHVRLINPKISEKLMWALMTPNADDDAEYEKYVLP